MVKKKINSHVNTIGFKVDLVVKKALTVKIGKHNSALKQTVTLYVRK